MAEDIEQARDGRFSDLPRPVAGSISIVLDSGPTLKIVAMDDGARAGVAIQRGTEQAGFWVESLTLDGVIQALEKLR